MQAQRVAPLDMQCKDKFLIQSTIVPFGSIEEEITSSTFAKDNGKYIEENKLRVVLLSPPSSPALPPFNGTLKQELEASTLREQLLIGVENLPPQMVRSDVVPPGAMIGNSSSPVFVVAVIGDASRFVVVSGAFVADSDTTELKPTMEMEDKELKLINAEELKLHKGVEELKLPKGVGELKSAKNMEWKSAKNMEKLKPTKNMGELEATKNVEEFKLTKDVEELKLTKGVEELKIGTNGELKPSKNGKFNLTNDTVEFKSFKDVEFKVPKDVEELKLAKFVGELKLHKDIEELKSKLIELESKLTGAEITISKLRDDRSTTNEESQLLQQELGPDNLTKLKPAEGYRKLEPEDFNDELQIIVDEDAEGRVYFRM
ncbi:hypothetical protein GIB67_013253 [Kingdonia uniflora]|uniref:Uncharacterized protein n=1 Tax=Kingdonia uniflora TaxID=39325 RepID=A0A7J7N5Z4_9MAGN|nr:hypothetical protein GIB67_013253 [Kingdonia uniflora]